MAWGTTSSVGIVFQACRHLPGNVMGYSTEAAGLMAQGGRVSVCPCSNA